MIHFFTSLPGLVYRFSNEHRFWAVLIGIVLLGGAYLLALKTWQAYDELRDVRNRRR